ncbi:MAG: hypothetical protein ABUL61_04555 [Oleiharenicola lentus]
MKSPRLRSLLLAAAFAVPVIAHAHPGHDGDHDFVWDFDHLATHPLATLAYVAIAGVAGWLVWRWIKSPKNEARERSRSDRR